MSADNDPYLELLNIRSPERPPNAYALLGIAEFESDRDTIEDAAGLRMGLLQELANSEHMDASQKLLNEISGARRLLLDTTKKIAYDEELRTRQKRSSSPGTSKRGGAGGPRTRRGKQAQKQMLPVGIAAGVALILGIVLLLTKGGSSNTGNVIVDWPSNQRQGAAVLMDGKPVQITDSQPLYLTVPQGRHRLVFQRTGYEDIPKTLNISKGTVNMKLNWTAEKSGGSQTSGVFDVPESFPGLDIKSP